MSALAFVPPYSSSDEHRPYRGTVAMLSLIIGESALFTILVVAYIFYLGKSLSGPTPRQVLELPIFNTVCLLSSSLTIWLAERQLERKRVSAFGIWVAVTTALGLTFLAGTALEWHKLVNQDGLTISTNLFGTTFYSLVGLHATHVVLGLLMLSCLLVLTVAGKVTEDQAARIGVLALYWHFVDAVWLVVFTVVYIVGR
jgi:cytochrome c oxidase subunit 3/cytochrome o ubiquinol oxidase subunit 3